MQALAFMFRAVIDCARWRGKGQNYPPRPKLLMPSHFSLAFFRRAVQSVLSTPPHTRTFILRSRHVCVLMLVRARGRPAEKKGALARMSYYYRTEEKGR